MSEHDIIVLRAQVEQDDICREVSRVQDYPFTGEVVTEIQQMPDPPEDFQLGLIVGTSGKGKTTLSKRFGEEEQIHWDPGRAVVSHFASAKEAQERLGAAGLKTIPAWLRPYHTLSTGERFRADVARRLKDGAVIDEFTSVVDRRVAKSTCVALRKHIDRNNLKRIVLVSCHADIVEWLEPDWVYDAATHKLVVGRYLHQRPTIRVKLYPCKRDLWELFKQHHYLSAKLHKAAECFLVVWDTGEEEEVVGFVAVLQTAHKESLCVRGHRVVILPEYQGLGLWKGVRALRDLYLARGYRYYMRSAHPAMIAYCKAHPEVYRHTGISKGEQEGENPAWTPTSRPAHGFEYLGESQDRERFAEARRRALEALEQEGERPERLSPQGAEKEKGTPKNRCQAILDAETQRRCRAPAVNGTGLCHVHGPNAKEWHSKGGKKGGAVVRKLWADRRRQAAALKQARTWSGYRELVLAQIKDEFDEGDNMDKKVLEKLFQRLEKALEKTLDDDGQELRVVFGSPRDEVGL